MWAWAEQEHTATGSSTRLCTHVWQSVAVSEFYSQSWIYLVMVWVFVMNSFGKLSLACIYILYVCYSNNALSHAIYTRFCWLLLILYFLAHRCNVNKPCNLMSQYINRHSRRLVLILCLFFSFIRLFVNAIHVFDKLLAITDNTILNQ